jgi:hypothetical protein
MKPQSFIVNTIKATIIALFIPFDLWIRCLEAVLTLLLFVPYEWASGRTEFVEYSIKNTFRPLDSWMSFRKLIGIAKGE